MIQIKRCRSTAAKKAHGIKAGQHRFDYPGSPPRKRPCYRGRVVTLGTAPRAAYLKTKLEKRKFEICSIGAVARSRRFMACPEGPKTQHSIFEEQFPVVIG